MSPPTSFNKAKALEEAARLVSQRKIPQAIKHYLAISEYDPSDLNLLNTIGDLCIRNGNTAEALRQFQRLADAYTHEGFLLKAVAIHKKISKLVPNEVEPLLKLAEHYSTLGLGREAREHYMQALALCEKQALNHKALEILRKLVKQEPENLAYRVRLGESCVVLGQNGPAAQVYAEIAEIAYKRGELAGIEQHLHRAQQLDPANVHANLLSARLAFDAHEASRAKEILQSSFALKANPEAVRLLLDVHFLEGNFDAATEVVTAAFWAGNDSTGILTHYVQACLSASDPDAALNPIREIAREASERSLLEAMIEPLRLISGKYPDHLPALELQVQVSERTPGGEALVRAVDSLCTAYLRAEQMDQAKSLYRQLLSRDPENALWQAKLNSILQTGAEPDETASAGVPQPVITESEEEPENPQVEEAIENASIFARYGLIDKAMDELDRALQSEPENLKLLKQTVEVSKQDRPKRAAQAADALAELLRKRGDLDGAAEFEELILNLQAPEDTGVPLQSGSPPGPSGPSSHIASPAEPSADQLGLDPQASDDGAASPMISAPAGQQISSPAHASSMALHRVSVSQIDLTEEVEALASIKTGQVEEEITSSPDIFTEEQAEIDFYLEYGFFVEAEQAVGALAEKFPNHPGLPALRKHVEEATQTSQVAQEEALEAEVDAARLPSGIRNGDGTLLGEETAQELAEEAQPVPEVATAENRAFEITPRLWELEPEVEPQDAQAPGEWTSEPLEEAQPPAQVIPVEEPSHVLDFEWTPADAQSVKDVGQATEPERTLPGPMPIKEFMLVPEVISMVPEPPPDEMIYTPPGQTPELALELPSWELVSPVGPPVAPEAVVFVPEMSPAGEHPPVPEAGSTVPELPLVEEFEPGAEALAGVQEVSPIADLLSIPETISTVPEPVPIQEHHPAPELPPEPVPEPILPTVGLVEELLPNNEVLPFIREQSPVQELQPAPQTASTITEQTSIEEPPPVPEITSEPGAGPVSPEPTPAGGAVPIAEQELAPIGIVPAGPHPPIPEPEPAHAESISVEEPSQFSQPILTREPVAASETKLPPLRKQQEPPPLLERPPEAPVKIPERKPAGPYSDLQAIIIDSAGDASGNEDRPAETIAPPGKRQVPLERPTVPKRPVTSFNQILQELSGDLAIAESPDSPEKHYNLGLAFREMDLLDEAIGEFQKVVRGSVKGNLPPRFLEACSLLAACFMQKGMPPIAVKWYQRALDVPGVDGDALLVLNYDLADAMDRAGQKKAALEKFMEVYSENIDYRDVADRIRALQHNLA